MNAERRCPGCGTTLPSASLDGLCPVCLLREGLAGHEPAWSETGEFDGSRSSLARPGALAALTELLAPGEVPRVLLRDSEVEAAPSPLVQPFSPEMPSAGDRSGRLQLLGEIARGGMGAVLKGRDPALGRDLAVKVLLESHREKPELIRRFIEEAQIGGQLQHPGIVPIYELGTFEDKRPYFAMKLVKGRTLASLLDERPDPAHEMTRFLSIFEAVCQTMAYAHARGVIHRDLKPSNIMVGSFGEVQVMDWGLAKVLPQGGVTDDAAAGKLCSCDTVIATARSGSDAELSQAGSVLGTPSYMAPEQARGEIDRLDERCDVFALGSILCEILTGEPTFTGRSSGEIQRKASRGDLGEALNRLDSSGAEIELIGLAKECLVAELEDRPPHASAVAEQINTYQTGVQDRLRRSEIERAEEKARADEATKRVRVERHRQRLTLALAASVFALIVLGVVGWMMRDANIFVELVMGRLLCASGRSYFEAEFRLRNALKRAEAFPRRGELAKSIEQQLRVAVRGVKTEDLHTLAERSRFRFGVDPPDRADAKALDQNVRAFWADRHLLISGATAPEGGVSRELWEIRERQIRTDLLDLVAIWADMRSRLATSNASRGAQQEAFEILEEARSTYGSNFSIDRIHQVLSECLAHPVAEQVSEVAPRSAYDHFDLGRSLLRSRQYAEAVEQFLLCLDQNPKEFWPNFYLASCEYRLGHFQAAESAFRISIALAPPGAEAECYFNRAVALEALGRRDEAAHEYSKALKGPKYAEALPARGMLLFKSGRHAGAIADFRRALGGKTEPKTFGRILYNLTLVYLAAGDRDSARKTLEILTHHVDLASIRDENQLKKLPEDEQKSWQAFWAEVSALLKQVG